MSNDKKGGNEKTVPLSRQPSQNETTGSRHITLDECVEFAEGYQRHIHVQNSLPPPEPIKKK